MEWDPVSYLLVCTIFVFNTTLLSSCLPARGSKYVASHGRVAGNGFRPVTATSEEQETCVASGISTSAQYKGNGQSRTLEPGGLLKKYDLDKVQSL